MDNLIFYNKFRSVPKEAQKTIQAGKLKGFTDINPMWRIKTLTETFGACGLGWTCSDVTYHIENAGGETAVFCSLNLKVKTNGEWSQPIYGIGGSKLAGKGVGDGINDEAYKMAFTDALSIACKNLGMAADIYYDKDRTKYNSVETIKPAPEVTAQEETELPPITPIAEETYWKLVKAFANGVLCPSGKTAREKFIELTNAREEHIAKFDHDVENVRFANEPQKKQRRKPANNETL